MIQAVIMMAGLGVVIGIGLAIASRIFYVYVDPMVEAVDDALPGANCGGCGYPGCAPNAEAIVAGKSSPGSCVAGGQDLAEAIAGILGLSLEAKEPDIAAPGCTYSVKEADRKYQYTGIPDCRAAALMSGGMKVCEIGCLGLGTCVRACPFDALKMGDNGLPVVDKEKCTGCGTCERVCPKHIIKLSSVTRRILKEYTVDDCTTPCQRACPAGIDIREYIRQINLGDYRQSVAVIKERNPFPTVIGRICPRFCENECRRTLVDESVAINGLKRFVADYEKINGRVKPFMAPETGRKTAIIGGGVEGLAAAFFIARLGHSPLVLEATDQLGGLLRKAIAAERLPADILNYDIEGILDIGVNAQTGKLAGRDFTIDSLLADGYEAVLLATGGWDSRLAAGGATAMQSPVDGFCLMIDLLKDDTTVKCGTNTVIVGGGPLATDAVKAAQKAGAANITVLFREDEAAAEAMGANANDILQAGGKAVFGAAIDTILGTGRVISKVTYTDLSTGEPQTLDADTLIFAAGRFPDLVFAPQQKNEGAASSQEASTVYSTPVDWKAVPPCKNPLYADQQGVFAEGDPVTDMDAAIKAISAGRRGAAAMHMIMYGDPLALPDDVITRNCVLQTVATLVDVAPAPRNIMPINSQADIAEGAELEVGFSESVARSEASRCLQCGLVCYEHK
ncbi:MAG: RnfABCDGE type electron transport complex subunit B [Thermodesulfobacteriota bacterium]|nr:RnfABCDGE type electron transport complex subunit B [Thermodesulfobacteriota bacterium]